MCGSSLWRAQSLETTVRERDARITTLEEALGRLVNEVENADHWLRHTDAHEMAKEALGSKLAAALRPADAATRKELHHE